MNARTLGVHRNRIRRTVVAHLDVQPTAERLPRVISLDGEEITTITASLDCAADLQEMGYTVTLVTAEPTMRISAPTRDAHTRFSAAQKALREIPQGASIEDMARILREYNDAAQTLAVAVSRDLDDA